MVDYNPTLLALIGTVMGGSGLKVVEYYLSKRKTKTDEATTIRTELRAEVDNLRKLMKEAETEVDVWREKYFALVNEVATLRAEAEAAKALARLKAEEAERLAIQAEVLKAAAPTLPKKRVRKVAPKPPEE
jgi:hypothetical protein